MKKSILFLSLLGVVCISQAQSKKDQPLEEDAFSRMYKIRHGRSYRSSISKGENYKHQKIIVYAAVGNIKIV